MFHNIFYRMHSIRLRMLVVTIIWQCHEGVSPLYPMFLCKFLSSIFVRETTSNRVSSSGEREDISLSSLLVFAKSSHFLNTFSWSRKHWLSRLSVLHNDLQYLLLTLLQGQALIAPEPGFFISLHIPGKSNTYCNNLTFMYTGASIYNG